jgi:predicted small metal-binding protein
MKTYTCTTCGSVIKGATDGDVMDKVTSHIDEAHKDLATERKSLSKDEQDKVLGEMQNNIQEVQ